MKTTSQKSPLRLATLSALTLAVSFQLVGGTMLNAAQAAQFTDTSGHWAQADIQVLSDSNIIGGYPDGSFRPEGSITRAEFAAIIAKALNIQANSRASYSEFNDMSTSHWAYPVVDALTDRNILSGYPNGGFAPNRTISRVETMAVLSKSKNLALPNESETNSILSQFADGNSVPGWARASVAAMVKAGLFENEPSRRNYIDPNVPASRGEVAALVYNLDHPGSNNSSVAANNNANAQANNPYNGNQQTQMNNQTQGQLQGRIVNIPAKTQFNGTVQTMISSDTARPGDAVELTLNQGLVDTNGQLVIPANSTIKGVVKEVTEAGRTGRNGILDIDFNELQTPNGQRFTIQADIATEEGVLKGGTAKGRVLKAVGKTALGAGVGAALGTAMGPLSGGKAGKGAIYGTAIGAGVGAVAAAAGEGEDVILRPGDMINIELTSPLVVPNS